jgi:uncharacterized membrane protein YdjX (TVP38/TMEM64 family)
MPSRRLIGVTALVGAAFAAGVILLPHSPADLRELIVAAGVAALAIALGAWILLSPAMFSGTVLAAFALARTAGRTHLGATVMRSAKLRKVHALLECRGFLAMLATRLMPGVPATGLNYVAGVASVGVPAFAAAMALGALVRTAPYAVLGRGIGWGRSPRS